MSFSRITPLMTTNQILGEINQSQNAMATTEEQLSTGKTINQPSDNPSGAALAVQLNGQLSQLGDYNNNIVDGQAWAQTGTTALNAMQQDVQTVNELVVEAAGGNLSNSQLNNIGSEIQQLASSMRSSANAQYNGQYVFNGTSTGTAPYDSSGNYQGATTYTPVTRQIGPAAHANVSVDLSSVLGTTSSPGLLSQLSAIAANLTSSSPDTSSLTGDIAGVQNGVTALGDLQSQLGTATDQMSMAASTLSDMQTSLTSELSNTQDANMATTMTTYSNEQAAFTAALKAGASIVQNSLMDFLTG